MSIRESDFVVDLSSREVRHRSGVVVEFYEYETREDWLIPSSALVKNPLFPGDSSKLVAAARRVAEAAGMKLFPLKPDFKDALLTLAGTGRKARR